MKIAPRLWARLMPLLESALDQPAGSRKAWLDRLAPGPEEHAALEQLLADREDIERRAFLEAPPRLAGPRRAGLQAGQRLGAYRLVRELGQGGMSVVWAAERDDGQLQRRVALKIPHAGPGQATLAERLRREQRILAALEHPHIARLYDVGVTEQGLPFLVLEHVEGQNLQAHCNERRLTVAQRLQLFLQVLGAVQHAHSLLVLHRDLKPSNILVTAGGDVKLLDFGIAKLLQGDQAFSTALTREGGRALTPDYAAPEQIAGAPLGTACDVYALGVVLFELLTGERPYRLPRDTPAALEEAILSAEPRRPSQAWLGSAAHAGAWHSTPARLRRQLRGDLDLIVLTALQKDPARRYASAEAFAHDLRRHLARQPVLARPDSRWYRMHRFVQCHALALTAATVTAAAIGSGSALALWQAREARLEAAKATAIKDFLIGLFESNSIEQQDALSKRRQNVQDLLEQSATALQTGLTGQPQVRTELQGVVGRLLHDLALDDAAVPLRRQRAELLAQHGAPLPERMAALRELAESLAQQGNDQAAGEVLLKAAGQCAGAGHDPPLACAMVHVSYGLGAARRHDIDTAARHIEPAVQAVMRQAPRSAEAAEALAALGEVRGMQNHADEAYALYLDALKLREALWGPHSVRLARERYLLANNLIAERRFPRAEIELRQAHEALLAALGPDHVSTAMVELLHGRLLLWVHGSGQDEVRHAGAVIERQQGHVSPDRAFQARMVVGEALLFDGRIAEALGEMEQAQAMPHSAGEIADVGDTMFALALQAAGRYAQARQRLQALRARHVAALGERHPYVADVDSRLARLDLAEGRLDEAEAAFDRALQSQDERENTFGSSKHLAAAGHALVDMERGRFERAWPVVSANYATARRTPRDAQYRNAFVGMELQMGRVLTGLGRAAEARPHFERAIEEFASGYPYHPDLAQVRARYAQCLLALHDVEAARRQLALAQQALQKEPGAGPYFHRVVAEAAAMLAGRP